MKTSSAKLKMFLVSTTAVLVLSACASQVSAPSGSAEVRAKLLQLQSTPDLATRAPIEIRDAEAAVAAAERPERDSELAQHRVLVADQKVEIASAWAESRLLEDQRVLLSEEAESARLASRTREADLARSDARTARSEADTANNAAAAARTQSQAARIDANSARSAADLARGQAAVAIIEADTARTDADLARQDTAAARAETEELQRQITELNARTTDRGLVVTLGDVLFETGDSTLRAGTAGDLNKLASFLNRYEDRSVTIEGHTDSVGTEMSNQSLSQRRADAVEAYLVSNGVDSSRISSSGKGESLPVSDNDTSTGRQQNRRVEVIISNVAAL